MRSYIENFLVLFSRLKSVLNNSSKNLKWLPNAKPEIAELCYQLDQTYVQLKRSFANQPTKISISPSIFQKRWDEYIANYQTTVGAIAKPIREKYKKEFVELLRKESEDANAKGQSPEEFWQKMSDDLPSTIGITFNPVEDDASSLLDELFVVIRDIVVNNDFPEVFTDKQIGALNYFRKVIGIDFHAINNRWGKTPRLFISEKITKKTDKLVEMYNEAVKSYIFGLNVCSTAMCRALLEHILINYYRIPKDSLDKVVSLAERRFKKLASLKLHKLRKDGNDVMHEYETTSRIEDAAVVGYLLTIRALVDSIPEN